MKKSERIERFLVYTVAVLLCLVLASSWLLGNIYARYTTSSTGSDSARVAKFSITDSGRATTQIQANVYPGFSQNYEVRVTNNSEVAIEYKIEAENKYGNLPLQFKMLDANGNDISSKHAEIPAGDNQEYTYHLNISWPLPSEDGSAGNAATGKSLQDPDYAGQTDIIEITLTAVQVD